MAETWYILKGETCGPNGRTYRDINGRLEVWVSSQWVLSYFHSLTNLKSFARNDYPNHKLTMIQKENSSE